MSRWLASLGWKRLPWRLPRSIGNRCGTFSKPSSIWLRRALWQAAWAASRTKGRYPAAQYHCLLVRKGKKKKIVAVAHTMLIIVYNVAKRQPDVRVTLGQGRRMPRNIIQ